MHIILLALSRICVDIRFLSDLRFRRNEYSQFKCIVNISYLIQNHSWTFHPPVRESLLRCQNFLFRTSRKHLLTSFMLSSMYILFLVRPFAVFVVVALQYVQTKKASSIWCRKFRSSQCFNGAFESVKTKQQAVKLYIKTLKSLRFIFSLSSFRLLGVCALVSSSSSVSIATPELLVSHLSQTLAHVLDVVQNVYLALEKSFWSVRCTCTAVENKEAPLVLL